MAYPQSTTPLKGEIVVLRSWSVGDAEWYVSSRDEEVFRWTTESRGLSIDEARENIERHLRELTFTAFAITDAGTGALLGNIALTPKSDPPRDEVSYWLAPEARGHGAATEALSLLTDWAFAGGGFQRIELHTHLSNATSQAVARRCGFDYEATRDGTLIFALYKPGAPR